MTSVVVTPIYYLPESTPKDAYGSGYFFQGTVSVVTNIDGTTFVVWNESYFSGNTYAVYGAALNDYNLDNAVRLSGDDINSLIFDPTIQASVVDLDGASFALSWVAQGTAWASIFSLDPYAPSERIYLDSPVVSNGFYGSTDLVPTDDGGILCVYPWTLGLQFSPLDIHISLISVDGLTVENRVPISSTVGPGDERRPHIENLVASENYALSWEESGSVFLAEVTDLGEVITLEEIATSSGQYFNHSMGQSLDGPSILLTYLSHSADGLRLVAELRHPGGLTSFELAVANTDPHWQPASVAALPDGRFAVVWQADASDATKIFLSFVDQTGASEPTELYSQPLISGLGADLAPVVAPHGSGVFVAWQSGVTDGNVMYAFAYANTPPSVADAISDQNATADKGFSFTFDANTFVDADPAEKLIYTATLVNGDPLPSWLSFDAITRTFSGTPRDEDVGSIVVKVTATDKSNTSVSDEFTLAVEDTNDAPTAVSLENIVSSLSENTSTENRIKVADIAVTDDALGKNTLSLTGEDAGVFEIEGGALYLKAGTTLDHEAKSSYSLMVEVDDVSVGTTPDANSTYLLTVTDVNEAPSTVAVSDAPASLAENLDLTNRIAVGSIAIADDALGSNAISLTGDDATLFEVDGTALYLKTGVSLDFETNRNLDVTVNVADVSVAGASDVSTNVSIAITNVNERPTNIILSSSAVQEFRANGTVVGALSTTDPDTGNSHNYTLLNNAGGRFALVGNQIRVANGLLLDFEQAGGHQIQVRVADQDGLTRTETVTITVGNVDPETVTGNAAANIFVGGAKNDFLSGLSSNDTLRGQGGNDILDGGTGIDRLEGGIGNDTFVVDSARDLVVELLNQGTDTVRTSATFTLSANIENGLVIGTLARHLTGSTLANTLTGNGAANKLFGGAGNDSLNGRSGNDTLIGGSGRDSMTGGSGADDFDFNLVSEIGNGATRDRIMDFQHLIDDIDLSTIDANGSAAGNTAFQFLAAKGAGFTDVKGQLRWVQIDAAGTASDRTIIEGDINGDRRADFQIELVGLKTLSSGDFVL